MNVTALKAMIRTEQGKPIMAHKLLGRMNWETLTIEYEAEFRVPAGTYTRTGVRYPDGHEMWGPSSGPITVGWWGDHITVYGKIRIS